MTEDHAQDPHPLRRRAIEWSDPSVLARAGHGLDGLRFLRKLMAGELPPPPLIALLGIDLVSAEQGRVIMRMMPGEYHYNPLGTVHGGAIASLLDSVMGCAVHSTLRHGRTFTTLEIKVNYLRAVTTASGPLTAFGEVVHGGRRQAVAEARLLDGSDRLCATASSTCLLLDAPGGDRAGPEIVDPVLAAWTQSA